MYKAAAGMAACVVAGATLYISYSGSNERLVREEIRKLMEQQQQQQSAGNGADNGKK